MKVKAAQDGQIVKNHEYVLVYGKTSAALSKKRTPLYEAASSFDQHYSYVITEENEVYKKQLLLSYLKDEGCESYFDKHKLAMSIGNIEWMIDNDPDFKKFIIERASVIYCEMACNINVPDDIVNQLKTGKIVKYKDYLLHMTSGGTIRQYRSFEECLHMTDDYSPEYCRAIIRGALWKGFYSDMMNINKEGGVTFKNGKKPVRLIKQLFKWANSTNATILDFFAGSGTTGQAVLELNAEDGGNRHFILCTNNEIYDPALRKQVDKEIRDAGSVMTEQAAAKLYAEIGVCHHVTYPRMQNIFKDHPDDSLRYMKINTDVKETGSDEADVRSVIDEFVPYIEIRENAYDAEKHDSYYQLASSTKDVLVFSADSDRCLIPYLKAKRLAKQVFADDGKEHVVYCETGTEQDADGVHFVPYPAQVLNRIKAGKKFVRREEIA